MYQEHYFEVTNCAFRTYLYDETAKDNRGDRVAYWYPTGKNRISRNSFVDCVKQYIYAPFSENPTDWQFDSERNKIVISVLSSRPCGSYARDGFAKKPTKKELADFEKGKGELYIVEFEANVEEISITSITEELARAEGLEII